MTELIVRTPLAAAYNNPTNDPSRDKLTGLPLDPQGRYTLQTSIGDKTYEPKYFPCAVADCVASGKNLDLSDPATQSYVKAVDKMILDDINKGATVITIVSPIGVAGAIAAVVGPVTSIMSGAVANELSGAALASAKETLQEASTRYLQYVAGIGEASAKRVTGLVDLAGGWQAVVDRFNSNEKKATP